METFLIFSAFGISLIAQVFLVNVYNKYKNKEISKDNTGFDVSRKILDKYGLNNVYITEVRGALNDHYYYPRKVVRLSKSVFHGTSILSTSIAAFESVHAIMDKENSKEYKCRVIFEPFMNILTMIGIIMIISGLFFDIKKIITIGAFLVFVYLLFQIVTLPIEFKASKRAMDELLDLSLITKKENDKVRRVLNAISFINLGSIYRTIKETFYIIYDFGRNR